MGGFFNANPAYRRVEDGEGEEGRGARSTEEGDLKKTAPFSFLRSSTRLISPVIQNDDFVEVKLL